MAIDVFSNLSQCITDCWITVEEMFVFASIPFGQCWELLRNGKEEVDDDADRGRFHLMTKLVDDCLVLVEVSNQIHEWLTPHEARPTWTR